MAWQSLEEKRNQEVLEKYSALPEETRKQLEKTSPRQETSQHKDISYSCSKMSDLIKEAKAFAKEWKKTLDDVSLEHSAYQHDYSDSYSSEVHLEVDGLETDVQYYSRLMANYESTRAREEYDRREFDRLKAKFSA